MKIRFLPLVLMAVLLLAFGALVAACGDDGNGADGELTLEQYFQRLEQLSQDYDEQAEAAFAEFDEADFESLTLEEQVEVIKDIADGLSPAFEDFVDGAKDLDPPPDVEDLHNDLVTASDDFLEAVQDVVDQIDDVQSQAELDALLEGGPAEAAEQRADEACFALQGVADENSIDVDLQCGDE